MNLKYAGIACIGLGVVILLVGVVLGIVIGVNNSTMTEIGNKENDERNDSDEDKAESAQAANAFLEIFNRGMITFGMGFVILGGGLFLSGGSKGNVLVMIIAALAVIVLLTTLILMTVMAVNVTTMTQIENKNDTQTADEDKYKSAEKNVAGLSPVVAIFGGYSIYSSYETMLLISGYFNFNSLAFVMPLLTLILGIGVTISDKKSATEPAKKTGGDAFQTETHSSPATTPPPPPKSFQNRDDYSQDYHRANYNDNQPTNYNDNRKSSYNDQYKSY